MRQECNYLSGWSPSREADKKRAAALQMLEVEQKRLQRKVLLVISCIDYVLDNGLETLLDISCIDYASR